MNQGILLAEKALIIVLTRLSVDPLSPNIHTQILHTDAHTFSPGEHYDDSHLIAFSLDYVLILLRENGCWSLLA